MSNQPLSEHRAEKLVKTLRLYETHGDTADSQVDSYCNVADLPELAQVLTDAVHAGALSVSGKGVKLVRTRLGRMDDKHRIDAMGNNKAGELVKHTKHTEFAMFVISPKSDDEPASRDKMWDRFMSQMGYDNHMEFVADAEAAWVRSQS